jgi:hypothetical protein
MQDLRPVGEVQRSVSLLRLDGIEVSVVVRDRFLSRDDTDVVIADVFSHLAVLADVHENLADREIHPGEDRVGEDRENIGLRDRHGEISVSKWSR